MYRAGNRGGFLPPANADEHILHWALWLRAREGCAVSLWTHDTALRVALQTDYPSWGNWIAKGGTTCW